MTSFYSAFRKKLRAGFQMRIPDELLRGVLVRNTRTRRPLQNHRHLCSGKKQMRGRNRPYRLKYLWLTMVGAEGFEPPTLCSQSRCATRLRYAPTEPSYQLVCDQASAWPKAPQPHEQTSPRLRWQPEPKLRKHQEDPTQPVIASGILAAPGR